MLQKVLTYSFYLLFAITPLIWLPQTSELFEYNKMLFVYFLTIIIASCWLLKTINDKRLTIKSTPLDIPLLIFFVANIFSTIFSIDSHISIWGYYSRSNGGLLSLISYLILYWALVSNFDKNQALNFLKSAIFGGVIVALWAIPEHFGASPSCLILTGEFSASCWVQDVQARVFATLGQPNWLAAYLAMLIFPSLYFALTTSSKASTIRYTLYTILFYLAFTFTYSRGSALGLLAGFGSFLGVFLYVHFKGGKLNISNPRGWIFILIAFLIINLLFGSALTNFKLFSKFAPPTRPSLVTITRPAGTQLESGGTESGKIRLIVWKGALEIFKHYPIFGSGVETFGLAYYQYRPIEHNLVSEWDFLYNKAHNEFLNYLATTGIIGFLAYMAIILTFIFWTLKRILKSSVKNQESSKSVLDSGFLTLATLSAYISYLVQNFFGFSVVITALFFYLFPALIFLITDSTKQFSFPYNLKPITYNLFSFIYKRPFYTKLAKIIVFIVVGLLIITLTKNFLADTYYTQGLRYNDVNPGKAYNNFLIASNLNPGEPLYKSEMAFAAASLAIAFSEEDATFSAKLKAGAEKETDLLLSKHPFNTSLYRTAIRTYYQLSVLDQSFINKTLKTLDQTIKLSPTDPKLTFNKAVILNSEGKNQEAIKVLQNTLKLRPNYKEAYLILATIYMEEKQFNEAQEILNQLLKLIPGDPEALEKLKELEK